MDRGDQEDHGVQLNNSPGLLPPLHWCERLGQVRLIRRPSPTQLSCVLTPVQMKMSRGEIEMHPEERARGHTPSRCPQSSALSQLQKTPDKKREKKETLIFLKSLSPVATWPTGRRESPCCTASLFNKVEESLLLWKIQS